jgi:hypothetical protein
MIISDLLDKEKKSTNMFFFKNRDINTKMEHAPPPFSGRTHGEEELCGISNYHQAGTKETSDSEYVCFITNKMIMCQHIN